MVLTFLDKDGAGSSSHSQPRRPLEASGKAPLIQVGWRGGGGISAFQPGRGRVQWEGQGSGWRGAGGGTGGGVAAGAGWTPTQSD